MIGKYHKKLEKSFGRNTENKVYVGKIREMNTEILNIYVGKEYSLISQDNNVVVCQSKEFIQLRKYVEETSYNKCKYYIDDEYVYIQGDLIYASIKYKARNVEDYKKVEEYFVIQTINTFDHFASDRLRGFSEYYLRNIPPITGTDKQIPIVITEGMTDWKYLEWAWNKILSDKKYKYDYENVNFELYHYVPENYPDETAFPRVQMDCNSLLEMCKAYSNRNLGGIYIFISDRDVPQITKQMNNNNTYKSWRNGVYSFSLPVPDFRKDMPEICIEHYFTDEEIKTEKTMENGIKKRLYLSNEFDQYGRAPQIDRFCTNRKACSGDVNKILDGSGSDKIFKLTDCEDHTNYGLSKSMFAESVFSDPDFSHIHYDTFKLVFDVIKTICFEEKKNN